MDDEAPDGCGAINENAWKDEFDLLVDAALEVVEFATGWAEVAKLFWLDVDDELPPPCILVIMLRKYLDVDDVRLGWAVFGASIVVAAAGVDDVFAAAAVLLLLLVDDEEKRPPELDDVECLDTCIVRTLRLPELLLLLLASLFLFDWFVTPVFEAVIAAAAAAAAVAADAAVAERVLRWANCKNKWLINIPFFNYCIILLT